MTTLQQLDTESQNPALSKALDSIEEHSKEAGVYLRTLFEFTEAYSNDPKYQAQPELVDKCFGRNGLEDDINEIIHHFMHDVSPLARTECLNALIQAVRDNPVYLYYVEQICDYFGIKLPGEDHHPEGVIRFYAPNLHFDQRDHVNFLLACGLQAIPDEGSGSHIKYIDPVTDNYMTVASRSGKIWLKNEIKTLLQKNFPVERIQAACDKLKIDFRVLSR